VSDEDRERKNTEEEDQLVANDSDSTAQREVENQHIQEALNKLSDDEANILIRRSLRVERESFQGAAPAA